MLVYAVKLNDILFQNKEKRKQESYVRINLKFILISLYLTVNDPCATHAPGHRFRRRYPVQFPLLKRSHTPDESRSINQQYYFRPFGPDGADRPDGESRSRGRHIRHAGYQRHVRPDHVQ